ncbi:hypothetical protein HML84_17235 [Alcanivorax sp. IO_7]|nr:hypothetical protein HML84_17235 [Alcanivorax sp. IO_7]
MLAAMIVEMGPSGTLDENAQTTVHMDSLLGKRHNPGLKVQILAIELMTHKDWSVP